MIESAWGSARTVPVDSAPAPSSPVWTVELEPALRARAGAWGWQPGGAAVTAEPERAHLPARPRWVDAPRPDVSGLVALRSSAITRLIWRIAFLVISIAALVVFASPILSLVDTIPSVARPLVPVVVGVLLLLATIGLIRGIARVGATSRDVRRYLRPYQDHVAHERARYHAALDEWEQAKRDADRPRPAASASAARWYPVAPAAEPIRIDVLGGDVARDGWASLLVMVGGDALAAGRRVTVLDFTGHEVGRNLLQLSARAGLSTNQVSFDAPPAVDLLAGLDPPTLADVLADAVTGRLEPLDIRHERALIVDILRRVMSALSAPVDFGRLAMGVEVLRQTDSGDTLSREEVARLADRFADLARDEWTAKHLRLLTSQLRSLQAATSPPAPPDSALPVWSTSRLDLIESTGVRDDAGELLDRMLVESAHRAASASSGDLLVVVGADHLGGTTLRRLAQRSRSSGLRLMLLIDQPQGDLEKLAGTGGAVCIMKMYNHKDATVAAEFVGRGHRFVVSSITRQVGRTFTEGGGDSLAAATSTAVSTKPGIFGGRGALSQWSDTRGHTWSTTRNWTAADNVSDSEALSRVYEFSVEPQEILAMPPTAFLLIDSTGAGRRITLADCNPGIALDSSVSPVPLATL